MFFATLNPERKCTYFSQPGFIPSCTCKKIVSTVDVFAASASFSEFLIFLMKTVGVLLKWIVPRFLQKLLKMFAFLT